jgi:hypothetical protein
VVVEDGIVDVEISLEIVLLSHLLLCCFAKNIPALKSEREFTFLIEVLYMKKRKKEELSKGA